MDIVYAMPDPGSVEFIDGETLRQWMASRTASIADVLTVTEQIAAALEAAVPVALFDVPVGRFRSGPFDGTYHYDVTADGQRFLVNTLVEAPPPPPITVVLNWTAGLKR